MCTSSVSRSSRNLVYARLAADAQFLNQSQITVGITAGNVLEQTAATADHLQQTTASHEIFLVDLEVLGKFLDALGQNTDLYACTTGILGVYLGVFNNC